MHIGNLSVERTDEYARVVAQVTWEDRERPRSELYFATLPEYADALSAKADVFLPALALLAAWYGEARLEIEGSVCPLLLEGVLANLQTLYAVERWERPLLRLEVDVDHDLPPRPMERTGAFVSRGIDSLFALRRNRDLVPDSHPFAIADIVYVQGAGFPEDRDFVLGRHAMGAVLQKLNVVAEDIRVDIVPVLTNLGHVAAVETQHFARFWDRHFHKAAIVSAGHALGRRFTRLVVACDQPHWQHSGPGYLSNLAHNYGSTSLEIVPSGGGFTRLEKLENLSHWRLGLDQLLVCTDRTNSNCGRCLKCMWARTALVALGRLSECRAFDDDDLSAEELRRVRIITPSYLLNTYGSLLVPLSASGRIDLLSAVEEVLGRAGPWDTWRERVISDLVTSVPAGSRFVLVDDCALQLDDLAEQRSAIPFPERDGRYWGSPPDDATAIAELERLRHENDATFLAVAWPSAWWFDTYPRWNAYVRERFTCLLDNPGVTIFDLRTSMESGESA